MPLKTPIKQNAKKKIEAAALQKNATQASMQIGMTTDVTASNGANVNKSAVNKPALNKPNTQNQEVMAAKTEAKNEPAKQKLSREKAGHEKSGWSTFKDSLKQGGENKCSQAQIAMNQCN